MLDHYKKEEVTHTGRIPGKIIYQRLYGAQCFSPLHWHRHIELNLFLSGCADFLINGRQYHCSEGSYVLINSGDLHTATAPLTIPERDRYQELITIQWDYDFLKHYAPVEGKLRFRTNVSDECRDQIAERIRRIGMLYNEKGICYEMRITSTLLDLGSILLESCLETGSKEPLLSDIKTFGQIKEAVEYIEAHYTEELSLQEVAEAMGWAPTYFSRKFRLYTGITYHEYLKQCRMKSAQNDLRMTDLTITEIAFKNGFPNVKSLIETFKQYHQMTPQKYRKEYKDPANAG